MHLVALMPWLLGCTPETNVSALTPEIAVVSDVVAFGDQAVLYEVESSNFISNAGRVDLELSLTLSGDEYGVFGLPVTSMTVAPDTTWTMPVTFLPDEYLDYSGLIEVTTNDPERPLVLISLTGTGVPAPAPDIALSSLTLDFGFVTTTSTNFITLSNQGDADLVLGAVTQTGSGAFILSTDPSGQTIGPGDDYPILITYAPTTDTGDNGTLTITSDDPDEPELQVTLLGNGGGTYEYPIASINCPTDADPPEFLQLNGTASYDPLDPEALLAYEWWVSESPVGSTSYIEPATSATTSMWVDLAGSYEVQLAVTNELGVRSAPARCEIDAVPPDLIHVELLWNTPNADLDLHLRQDGFALFDEPEDCSYCNPSPNWGTSGTDDDPILDLDDYAGYGPENIVIAVPEDGEYIVAVHYFDDHGDAEVTATVRVWVAGIMAEEVTQVLLRNEQWDAARIVWPGGAVLPIEDPVVVAAVRACD
jgi:hypothetical protein